MSNQPNLKDILDKLVVDCGEEYHKLHSGTQDFTLTDARMNYYEQEAIREITALFPPTKIVKVAKSEVWTDDYSRGYNSGYVAAKRGKENTSYEQ